MALRLLHKLPFRTYASTLCTVRCNKNANRLPSAFIFCVSDRRFFSELNQAISNAKQLVGSSSNLCWDFLTSEAGRGSATYLRKLLNTSHPLTKTVRHLTGTNEHALQIRGLIVLLLSRCAGHIEGSPQMLLGEWDEACVNGITSRQRAMAEIVEMIHASHLLHRDVMNISRDLISDDVLLKELQYGNKIGILVGDVLIAMAAKRTTELNDAKILELIAVSIGDFAKSEFMLRHDALGRVFPPQRMDLASWEARVMLNTGSLLGRACQSAMIMAGHNGVTQNRANKFGRTLGLAWQLYEELSTVILEKTLEADIPFDLTALPVVLFLRQHPDVLASLESSLHDVTRIDYATLRQRINSSEALEEARRRLSDYAHMCLAETEGFSQCYKAKEALTNMLVALKDIDVNV